MKTGLGEDWEVVAEGLPGRTTVHADPVEGGHLSGLAYLRPCLESHRPLDLLIFMLGTNDFKRRFCLEAEEVALGVQQLVMTSLQLDAFGGKKPHVFVLCPPPIIVTGLLGPMFEGADRKSRQLAPVLEAVAKSCGAGFLDAGQVVQSSPIDGIHFEAEAQAALGQAVAKALPAFFAAQ
jgi:lysophospholipase L1-like esterase